MTFAEYRNTVIQLFKKCIQYALQTEQQKVADQVARILKDMGERRFNLVVCGEIKRGKSTLLTNFLEEDLIFPIDIDTCTNVVTVVQYGEQEKIEVIFEDDPENGIVHESKIISRPEIAEYVTEQNNENNYKTVNCLNVTIPNKKLKDGFRFFDTPGLGSMNPDHAFKTENCLDTADAVVFVFDAPVTESELNFLKRTYTRCKNFLVVLTKADQKNLKEIEILVDNTKNKIAQTLELDYDDIPLVTVSSKAKAKFLEIKEEKDFIASNFKAFENDLWKLLYNNRVSVVILPYLQQLINVTAKRLADINLENDALDSNAKEIIDELNKKIDDRNQLLTNSNVWKEDIRHEMNVISMNTQELITNDMQGIIEKLDEMYSEKTLTNTMKAAEEINSALSDTIRDVKRQIELKVDDLNAISYEKLGLTIEYNGLVLEKIKYNSKEYVSYPKIRVDEVDSMIQHGRVIAGSGLGAGAAYGFVAGLAGGIVGFFTGGPVGAIAMGKSFAAFASVVAGSAGSIKGAYNSIMKSRHQDLPAIRSACANYVSQSAQSIRSSAQLTVTELTKLMCDQISAQIKQQSEEHQNTINKIKQNQALSAKDAAKERERLNKSARTFSEFQRSAEGLSALINK